jgi:transposase
MIRYLLGDLKWRIVYLKNDGYSAQKIAQYLYIHVSTVKRVLQTFNKWGCIKDPFKRKGGRHKFLCAKDMAVCVQSILL